MVEASPGSRPRPLSPHLLHWRWHVTMTNSILHRVAGVGLYAGLIIVAVWAAALAYGPHAYGVVCGLLGSIPGLVVLFAITVCLFFHMANGVRHLFWDIGKGFQPRTASATAWFALVFGAAAAVAVWILILPLGGA
jgi:succinate dehydrogenase / fumarate reductase cytochrome b subunit